MNAGLPQRTVAYNTANTDASRWDRFAPRDDDIFICTPPKCGTTWTQAICALLIFGRPDHGLKPGVISPWLDADTVPVDDMLDMLQAQSHRRFLKTHTPLDGIPFYPQCTYLVVHRDPRDAYFSMRNHATNMKSGKFADRATEDVGAGFRDWAEKPYIAGERDNFSLAAMVHHFRTYRQFAHLPNMNLLHFSDMKQNLHDAMARVARILGIKISTTVMDALVQAAGFENMKKNAGQFAPGTGRWKDESRFFNKGTDNQWAGLLNEDDMAHYDSCMGALLPKGDVARLQDGDGSRRTMSGYCGFVSRRSQTRRAAASNTQAAGNRLKP